MCNIMKRLKQLLMNMFCKHDYRVVHSQLAGVGNRRVVYFKCLKCNKEKKELV